MCFKAGWDSSSEVRSSRSGRVSAVLARRGTPHTYRNAGDVEAEYVLVMPPRIASLIEAIHQPGLDVRALFKAHASEILG
jgi:hypothetical protein